MFGKVSWGSIARAFVGGVVVYTVPRVLDALAVVNASGNFNLTKSIVIGFAAGVVGAGLRALLPYLPVGPTLKGEK